MTDATVIINNYNYAAYLRSAIDSALDQSGCSVQVIVVDDGSTDNSLKTIEEYGNSVVLVAKDNGGQMSAFVAGAKKATGKRIFLLDADDVFRKNYCSDTMSLAQEFQAPDLIFSSSRLERDGEIVGVRNVQSAQDYGYSFALSAFQRRWLGQPTSSISIECRAFRHILNEFSGLENLFRICADDVIVVGADVLGYRKLFSPYDGVSQRIHLENGFTDKSKSEAFYYQRYLARERLWEKSVNVQWASRALSAEFKTKNNVPASEKDLYLSTVKFLKIPVVSKIRVWVSLWKTPL